MSDSPIPKGLNPFTLPPSPINRRKRGGGCRLACPGKLGCFHQKPPSFFGRFKKVQVGQITIYTPFFTKYTPFEFFYRFLFETLQNFKDYAMIPVFLPKRRETLRILKQCLFWPLECCETLRITQQCLFWLPECCETLRIMQQCLFWLSECCETLQITQKCSFWGSRREQARFDIRPQVSSNEIRVWQLPIFTYLLLETKGK